VRPYGDKIERLEMAHCGMGRWTNLGKIDDLERGIAPFSETYARFPKLVKAFVGIATYIVNNRPLIPNYGERYRNGEPIANRICRIDGERSVSKRFCKKQQMQWSKAGAHVLCQRGYER